jgi:hypothetical protein
MAWLSAGISNQDMVQQMVDNKVINSKAIHIAFKFTDRGDFVHEEHRYTDKVHYYCNYSCNYLELRRILTDPSKIGTSTSVRLICTQQYWESWSYHMVYLS